MPILDLQMRMRQLGEIRIGHVVDTGRVSEKTGKKILRPEKLKAFRFTSPSQEILASVAKLYGGEVKPWTPANGGPAEFEVYSTATRLPVLIPPRDAVSQWYELYAGSKCLRRCDGRLEQKSDKACMCNPERRQCSITTRVNVMLKDVPALGQWLLISKGYYAAVELPPAAELLAQAGGYVPGWLGMEEKSVVREEGPTRFMVPTLDVEITPAALMSGQAAVALAAGAGRAEVVQADRAAIEAAPAAPAAPPRDFLALAQKAATADDVRKIYNEAKAAGAPAEYLADLAKVGTSKPGANQAESKPAAVPVEAEDEPIEAEFVDEDPTEVWGQIVFAAGGRGWTTDQIEQEFAKRNGGTMPGSAEVSDLQNFLAYLRKPQGSTA